MSNLVEHARRELERLGEFRESPAYAQSIVAAVAALESYDGHSGGSMGSAIDVLHTLLQFRPLTPLTNDPDEWHQHEDRLWQNRRDSAAFSSDRGATYRYVDDRKETGRHMSVDVLAGGLHVAMATAPVDECSPPPPVAVDPGVPYVACDACAGGDNCQRHRTREQVAEDAALCCCDDPVRDRCRLSYPPHRQRPYVDPGVPG